MAPVDPHSFRWVRGEDLLQTYVGQHGHGIGFCRRCGTTICGLFDGHVRGITLGTLDGDPDVKIADHIFVGSKANWDEICGDAPQFDAWPETADEAG